MSYLACTRLPFHSRAPQPLTIRCSLFKEEGIFKAPTSFYVPSARTRSCRSTLFPETEAAYLQAYTMRPPDLHPDYGVIKGDVDEWLGNVAFNAKHYPRRDVAKHWGICYFMCLTTPRGDKERLARAIKLLAWLHVASDVWDDDDAAAAVTTTGGASREEESWEEEVGLGNFVCGVLEGRLGPDNVCEWMEHSSPAMLALARLWDQELAPDMPLQLRLQFARRMRDFLRARGSLQKLRATKRSVPIRDYLRLRRRSSTARLSFLVSRYALGVDHAMLDESTCATADAMVEHSERSAAEHIAWVADLYAFRKGYLQGDCYNLPALLCLHYAYSIQEAVNRVYRMIERAEMKYYKLHCILNSKPTLNEGMKHYITTLAFWMFGNFPHMYNVEVSRKRNT